MRRPTLRKESAAKAESRDEGGQAAPGPISRGAKNAAVSRDKGQEGALRMPCAEAGWYREE